MPLSCEIKTTLSSERGYLFSPKIQQFPIHESQQPVVVVVVVIDCLCAPRPSQAADCCHRQTFGAGCFLPKSFISICIFIVFSACSFCFAAEARRFGSGPPTGRTGNIQVQPGSDGATDDGSRATDTHQLTKEDQAGSFHKHAATS